MSDEEEATLPGDSTDTRKDSSAGDSQKRGRGRPAGGGGGGGGRKRPAEDDADAEHKERDDDDAAKRSTMQKKLKLTLPIHKFSKALKAQSHTKRVGGGTAVIMTSVIEYVTSEILELAGNTAKEGNKNRIIPKHIQQAVRNDEELNKYFANVTIAGGGVVPSVHATALPKKDKAKARPRSTAASAGAVVDESASQVY